jgi:hypothetical protein
MDTAGSSETVVAIYQTTWHHIPETRHVNSHRHEYIEYQTLNLKNVVFWDVALCRSYVNRRFGGTYRLHLQGRKIRER